MGFPGHSVFLRGTYRSIPYSGWAVVSTVTGVWIPTTLVVCEDSHMQKAWCLCVSEQNHTNTHIGECQGNDGPCPSWLLPDDFCEDTVSQCSHLSMCQWYA